VELFATMKDVKIVGLDDLVDLLGLPHVKVVEMQRNLHSYSQLRDAYLDLYATGHPCPSWWQVAKALRGVGLDHQAATVESTYIQGRERYVCTIMVFIG
jgi:hypothetical protein